jgi:hypothetical protein
MMLRGPAARCALFAAMMRFSCAQAGVWGVDPSFGLVGDYSTNAQLLNVPHTSDTDGALLLSAPTSYNGNAVALFVTPSFRISNSPGYSSVTSDYEHLTVKGEFDTERDVLTASAVLAQDSSLYYDYLTDGGIGVRRDSWVADLNWDRKLTERMEFDTDATSTDVHYAEGNGIPTLTDYKYTSLSPTLAWNSSERGKLTVAASVGLYQAIDGSTSSRNANLQAGFVRQLTEIWSLTSSAGYSRANNRLNAETERLEFTPNGPEIVLVPLTLQSTQNGTVYSVALSRKGERLSLNATASRQLAATGFEYLSLQNSVELSANYTYSDRLSFGSDVRYLKSQTPEQFASSQTSAPTLVNQSVTPKFFSLSANWRWTEHWTATLSASYVTEVYTPPTPSIHVSSSELSITLSRQFDHIKFQ